MRHEDPDKAHGHPIDPRDVDLGPLLPTAEKTIPRYGFSVAGLNILQNIHLVTQFGDVPRIYPLPHATRWFSGLVNQRNNLIPAYDLKALGGDHFDSPEHQHLLTVNLGEATVGLFIDTIPALVSHGIEEIESYGTNLPDQVQAAVQHVYRIDSHTWLDIDFHELFFQLATT